MIKYINNDILDNINNLKQIALFHKFKYIEECMTHAVDTERIIWKEKLEHLNENDDDPYYIQLMEELLLEQEILIDSWINLYLISRN